MQPVCALVVSHCVLGLGPKDAIDSKHGQRKARINESPLDLLDCGPATSTSQKAFVVEASLKHRVTDEARRLQVVAVANRALHRSLVVTLLRHVRQLVGEQTLSGTSCGHELPCTEYNIVTDGVRSCVYRPSRFGSFPIGMDSYITEITTKARLNERARLRIKRLSARVQHVMHDRRRAGGALRIIRTPLQQLH
jgi:hypothetical protein